MMFSRAFLVFYFLLYHHIGALRIGSSELRIKSYEKDVLQDLVTWDQHSLFVRGERVMFFSGEFHPFRLPVPGLWLDVFQKIKALGFSGVSFYTDWALLEGNAGHVITDGIWNLDEFFKAASEAGIYLLARPGPYINAETAAGGMPGWLLRIKGVLRSDAPDYLNATDLYMKTIGKIIADAQITKGGPVIMVQPENEYSNWPNVNTTEFPLQLNRKVMSYVENQLKDAGIVVPLVVNDNLALGSFAPGTGLGSVDLYGIDSYPLRYDCSNPDVWPTYRWPTGWHTTHEAESPTTPFAIVEFQGGSGGSWGGYLEEMCAALVGPAAERVVYKNNYSFGATIFNIYMTYGGTNWGNLGYHGGYTSYDYGAAISEDRYIVREKYPELKLQANFLKSSPAYLTATPGAQANGSYGTPSSIGITPLFGNGSTTNFYVLRHADFTDNGTTNYTLSIPTSIGNLTLPQLGGTLTLSGRDSKIHVTDYDIDGINLIYSTAEIYTWAKTGNGGRVLLLYGGEGESHEAAFALSAGSPTLIEGSDITMRRKEDALVIHWDVTTDRKVLQLGKLKVYLLWRNEAYNYWPLELPAAEPVGNFTSPSKSSVIINGGYLLRSAKIQGTELHLSGDLNTTTTLEVIAAPSPGLQQIFLNNKKLPTSKSPTGSLIAKADYILPSITVPDFSTLKWNYIESLPEIQSSYNDSLWTSLDHTTTNNSLGLSTPTSLYSSDYGYHTGSLIYRGHFTSTGNESSFFVNTTGGVGFGNSIWLNDVWISSYPGNASLQLYAETVNFPQPLISGKEYVITIVIDHMGQDEEAPGTDAVKFPRGMLDYELSGHPKSDVAWKLTGNFGGEQYPDLVRGPRNEGAFFAERQGYHQPSPPSHNWSVSSPVDDGLSKPGIVFYTASFSLDLPTGYDTPLSIVYNDGKFGINSTGYNYRSQFFINGYQFGKYVNNLGPQTNFPVPEGILNYNGENTIALTLWAFDRNGAQLSDFKLVPQTPILSGYRKPASVPQPAWSRRDGAY